jgi:hypothetical protein
MTIIFFPGEQYDDIVITYPALCSSLAPGRRHCTNNATNSHVPLKLLWN